jgi:hypothetical protein
MQRKTHYQNTFIMHSVSQPRTKPCKSFFKMYGMQGIRGIWNILKSWYSICWSCIRLLFLTVFFKVSCLGQTVKHVELPCYSHSVESVHKRTVPRHCSENTNRTNLHRLSTAYSSTIPKYRSVTYESSFKYILITLVINSTNMTQRHLLVWS